MSFKREVLLGDLKFAVRELVWAAMLSPQATLSGLRRPWLDGRTSEGDVAVRYVDVDYLAIANDATNYWADYELNESFDFGYVLTGRDIPIPRLSLYRALSHLQLGCTEDEASDAIRELLTEARENRQWSALWGARVQVDVGPLRYLDVFDLEGEFIGVFRDAAGRFLMVPVNVSTGGYAPPMILSANEDETIVEENDQAALALGLIVASVVRDFLVVEERATQFVARPAKPASLCEG